MRTPVDTEATRALIAKIKKGDAENAENLYLHEIDRQNPHQVTAHQVGAYTSEETDDRISDALSGEVGGWLGNLTVAQVNAITTHKKGDSATMLDDGTVMPGNVDVELGDDIMWVDSLGVWQPKISDHLHHDDTLHGTGSTDDPLGVVIDEYLIPNSPNPVENGAVHDALEGKQDNLTEMTQQEVDDLIAALGDL